MIRNFTWLCRLAAIHMIFLHVSLVWTLFTFGFVKMAWPSTLLNQLSFSLAHHIDSNLCLVSSLSMSLGQSFQFLIRSRYPVQHLISTSQWNLTLKLYSVPAFITSAHLDRFVRPWMTVWLVPWRLRLFHAVWSRRPIDYVNSILYGTSLKNIVSSEFSTHSRVVTHRRSHALPSATALLKQLHSIPVEWRIRFKLATMTFKALHTGRPP